jgi:hypothetical protein
VSLESSLSFLIKRFYLQISCDLCYPECSFANVSSYRRHIRSIHLQEKNHICTACGQAFFRLNVLCKHIDKAHLENSKPKERKKKAKALKTEKCLKSFTPSKRDKNHTKAVESSKKKNPRRAKKVLKKVSKTKSVICQTIEKKPEISEEPASKKVRRSLRIHIKGETK